MSRYDVPRAARRQLIEPRRVSAWPEQASAPYQAGSSIPAESRRPTKRPITASSDRP
ncbi:hypothetical protein C7S16_5738 [Burkholderia thailandensis]|uniref:Uncharacterized protein n=1 Tax=Burkholderia thailandensis TaxID=57975 RepID=A0AAW9CPJ0_BURTH|nr:hypothetical protein [Burkholderia thailandensis]MDW9252087.1 hypothetical protein [Burkholderia thailandensis]